MLRSRKHRQRALRIESLESRRLLSGNNSSEDIFSEGMRADIWTFPSPLQVATSLVSATDAGSTRDTAADIGSLNGTKQLAGSLSRTDSIDVIQFTIDRDADFSVRLSNLNRDADLYFFDAAGKQIASSILPGRSIDSIAGILEAGTYFIAVVNGTLNSTNYRLRFSANLRPEPAPPTGPPPTTTTTPTTTAPPSTNPPSTDTVKPLTDVAYFGGSREWNLNAVGAPEAWAAGYTGKGVTVAVIDTGVDLNHPDLVQNLYVNAGEIAGNGIDDDQNGFVDDVHGYDFVDGDASPDDLNGHGTHVAGTIAAARNNIGSTGVAPDAKIIPVRVLDRNGSGSDANVAAGIRYAAKLGADIINLSLGGVYSRAIDSAINYARSLGTIIIAAAGNESAAVPGYPARFSATDDNVISVGAYGSSGSIASFSNRVGNSGSVQIDAPGVGIYSTYLGGGYATLSGTSMASPHIAGLAALTLSANPNLTSRELRDLLANDTSGRAAGSDSFGKANASITVAYAAAGLKTASTASAGQRVATTAGTQRTVTAQTTVANDLQFAASEPIAKIDFKQADVTNRYTDPTLTISLPPSPSSKPLFLNAVCVTRTNAFDDFLASYDADEREDETSNELKSLV